MINIFRSKMTSNIQVSTGKGYLFEDSYIWIDEANRAEMIQCMFRERGRDFDVLPENLGISHGFLFKNL